MPIPFDAHCSSACPSVCHTHFPRKGNYSIHTRTVAPVISKAKARCGPASHCCRRSSRRPDSHTPIRQTKGDGGGGPAVRASLPSSSSSSSLIRRSTPLANPETDHDLIGHISGVERTYARRGRYPVIVAKVIISLRESHWPSSLALMPMAHAASAP